jgi:hypothetical protein
MNDAIAMMQGPRSACMIDSADHTREGGRM